MAVGSGGDGGISGSCGSVCRVGEGRNDHGDDGGNWWCWCCWLYNGGVNDYVSNWQAKPVKKKYSVLPKLKTLTRTAQL